MVGAGAKRRKGEKAKRRKERLGSERRDAYYLHIGLQSWIPISGVRCTLQVGSAGLGWYTLHIVVAQSVAVAAENQEIGYDQTPSSKRNTGRGATGGSPDGKRLMNKQKKNGSDSIESKRAAIEWLSKGEKKGKEKRKKKRNHDML